MGQTLSEKYFETYCTRRKIRWRPVAVGQTRTPDYDIFLRRFKIVTEVKEITANPDEKKAQKDLKVKRFSIVSLTPGDRVRKKISEALPQIKARAKRRFPGLLVLFDNNIATRHVDPYQIRVAMYGFESMVFAVPDDLNKRPHVVGTKFGPKRKMTEAHNTSISAIAALDVRAKDRIELVVYHNKYAAVPLDPKLFAHYAVPQYRLGDAEPGQIPQWVEFLADDCRRRYPIGR